METIVGALEVCLEIAKERDPVTVQNLSRQFKRWRRDQGKGKREQGWLEVRTGKGHGPSIYFRWREPGERKIHTE